MIRIEISDEELRIAKAYARAACMGGTSRIRTEDRQELLYRDQLVGQLGNLAWHKYRYRHLEFYHASRFFQNLFPQLGDGGSDDPGSNVDVKTSLMKGKNPWTYRLAVRPHECHEGTVYVLALVPTPFEGDPCVLLVGWASSEQLPLAAETEGVFKGAHVIPARQLTPLPPLEVAWAA